MTTIAYRKTLVAALTICWIFAANAVESTDVFLLGGMYRMRLTTGDILVGTVEFKDDTSLILETDEKPFSFRCALVLEYDILKAPEKKPEDQSGGNGARELSYAFLMSHGKGAGMIEVAVAQGPTFRGSVLEADNEELRLDVEGARIPISRDVIARISTIPAEKPDAGEAAPEPDKKKPQGPFDSVYVKNPQTDEYGNSLPDLLIVGTVKAQDADLSIETIDGEQKTIESESITRVVRNTSSSYEDEIARYAKPLSCPANMIKVDIPPGMSDRPFLKVCFDKYEFPNNQGAMPRGNVSYEQAQKLCESQGKRLCTAEEWQWACSGLEGFSYPYGNQMDEEICNTKGAKLTEASGNRHQCVSKFGIYDMTGNIFEWVTGADGEPMLMGGPYSKCQTLSPGVGGGAKSQTGFRCCKSN
jgi:hypothetical protein